MSIKYDSIILDDNLSVLRQLPARSVHLVYVDPPFGTGRFQQIKSTAYEPVDGYLDGLTGSMWLDHIRERMVEVHRVLATAGSLFFHIDYRNAPYIRLILDEIFGRERLVNEIIWAYDYGGRGRSNWPAKHDNIYWYAKSPHYTFNYDEIERIPYMAPGLVGPEKAAIGKLPTDVWWQTIVPTNGAERTGYPNQKPEKILERIIVACSNPGNLVADFYCGSGTTGAVAKRLGRHYLMVDINEVAVHVSRKRLENA